MKFILLGIFFLASSTLFAESADLPPGLGEFYSSFIQAAQKQDIAEIKSSLLPGTLEITATPRKKNPEYGTDINLHFLKSGFSSKIASISNTSDFTTSIRTPSTFISFVKVASGRWYIYRYFDKPIE